MLLRSGAPHKYDGVYSVGVSQGEVEEEGCKTPVDQVEIIRNLPVMPLQGSRGSERRDRTDKFVLCFTIMVRKACPT